MTLTILNTTENALLKFKNDPIKRDCYTQSEFYFKYLSYDAGFGYSMTNCLYESVLEVIIKECKCNPTFAGFVEYSNNLELCTGHGKKLKTFKILALIFYVH